MAEIDGTNGNGNHEGVVLDIKDNYPSSTSVKEDSILNFSVPFLQKMVAEIAGTYFLIFAGCSSVAVNLNFDKVVTLPGISITWGLAVMVLVYSVGHISGAHFNPAVTLAFATCKRFPWKQVPAYIACQVIGSTLAAGTIRLIFPGPSRSLYRNTSSRIQSAVLCCRVYNHILPHVHHLRRRH
ncbi:AQUAPORIN NIP2-1 [Salix purpurea]|uniref:AQUAPORIN NIP2-1 n=1 Tax=Salix purpurea TaxID=77065 RepID=A0A9Q0WGL0_SALPP|nr:AQUAPORIN NIP2-1 [Salix purpurea]